MVSVLVSVNPRGIFLHFTFVLALLHFSCGWLVRLCGRRSVFFMFNKTVAMLQQDGT